MSFQKSNSSPIGEINIFDFAYFSFLVSQNWVNNNYELRSLLPAIAGITNYELRITNGPIQILQVIISKIPLMFP
jgi:hypothetical protein